MGKCFVVFLASTMIHPACYKMLVLHVYEGVCQMNSGHLTEGVSTQGPA